MMQLPEQARMQLPAVRPVAHNDSELYCKFQRQPSHGLRHQK
jgi:hypothetical protein